MPTKRYGMPVLGLVLAVALPARADETVAARALLDRAIQAQGGEAQLAKFPAVTVKLKGTYHGLGKPFPFTGELATQGPDRLRFTVSGQSEGNKVRFVSVLVGDKGWFKFNDATEELNEKDLAEAKEEAYTAWLESLLPLKGKGFVLAPLGEVKIDSRPALGVRVTSKGHRDLSLYFDKQTGLLVKSETLVLDDNGQEVTEETFLGNYQEVQGTRQALKVTIKRDGKPYLAGEVTECRLAEKLEDSVFAKP